MRISEFKATDTGIEELLINKHLSPYKTVITPDILSEMIYLEYSKSEDVDDIFSWFAEVAKNHDCSIVYYHYFNYDPEDYFISIEDLLEELPLDLDDEDISDEFFEDFAEIATAYNDTLQDIDQGSLDILHLYFIYNGRIITYSFKNFEIPTFDDFMMQDLEHEFIA